VAFSRSNSSVTSGKAMQLTNQIIAHFIAQPTRENAK
jgi:hypothetical protein